jgi:hypothetical protein
MAGYVHKTEVQRLAIPARQIHMREAQVNGDTTPLLFLQAVGIDAGEGLYERGFSVIDVSGGADDDRFHPQES